MSISIENLSTLNESEEFLVNPKHEDFAFLGRELFMYPDFVEAVKEADLSDVALKLESEFPGIDMDRLVIGGLCPNYALMAQTDEDRYCLLVILRQYKDWTYASDGRYWWNLYKRAQNANQTLK